MLIAVMTCHAAPVSAIDMPDRVRIDHTLRLPAIRETWANSDTKFFFGRGARDVREDEVILDCGDSYYDTAFKVREMCRWALYNGHDGMFKTDDDTYTRPERAASAGWEMHDFVCRVLPATDINHPCPYPYGGCGYFLGKRMLEAGANDVHATSNPEGDTWQRCNTYEDAWIGRVARDANVTMIDDWRLKCLRHATADFEGYDWRTETPRKDNDRIAVCEFPGEMMREAHKVWTGEMLRSS